MSEDAGCQGKLSPASGILLCLEFGPSATHWENMEGRKGKILRRDVLRRLRSINVSESGPQCVARELNRERPKTFSIFFQSGHVVIC
jgi:hypothetical protein